MANFLQEAANQQLKFANTPLEENINFKKYTVE